VDSQPQVAAASPAQGNSQKLGQLSFQADPVSYRRDLTPQLGATLECEELIPRADPTQQQGHMTPQIGTSLEYKALEAPLNAELGGSQQRDLHDKFNLNPEMPCMSAPTQLEALGVSLSSI